MASAQEPPPYTRLPLEPRIVSMVLALVAAMLPLQLRGSRWLGLLLVFLMPCTLAQTAPTLQSDTTESREGYFVLSWSSSDNSADILQLQQADNVTFTAARNREIPATGALTLTGFANGDYYFRVGQPGNWSDTVTVRVNHHSLARALGFFAVGLVLFIVLCGAILHGTIRTRREDTE